MPKYVLAVAVFSLFSFANAGMMDKAKSFLKGVEDYAENMKNDATFELEHPIENNNMSIEYKLYSPHNPRRYCVLEPTEESVRSCSFTSRYDTKVLIHGYKVKMEKGNTFEVMKNYLLEQNPYNIIIVNWTLYNGEPYALAVANTYIVGKKVAELLNFLQNNRGLKMETTHIIGHSLGAHVSGHAGFNVRNLGRISGLDPAGPLFEVPLPFHELSYLDATFVDVIHSSDRVHGFGTYRPLGHMDFYPNGGIQQPACDYGHQFYNVGHESETISTKSQLVRCNHAAAVNYYLASIKDCRFRGTKCGRYFDFKKGSCSKYTSVVAEMGLHSVKIPNVRPYTRFFLNTTDQFPYC